jgi:purine-nucleoside phosphorylase
MNQVPMSPDTLVILGSGLSGCFAVDEYDIIGDDAAVTVKGHSGKLAILRGMGGGVMIALGRRHMYEGHSGDDVQGTVRYAISHGVRNLIVTNAAGGLNPRFRTGDIMLITDTIGSLIGRSLAITPIVNGGIERGRPMASFATDLYDSIELGAMEHSVYLQRGVYAGVSGPSYETRAEIRMLRRMGADAVGMSTLAEVAAAHQGSMRVVGLSLISNTLSDTARIALDHDDVVEQGRLARERMRLTIDAAIAVLYL